MWDKITYAFPNFNGWTVEVWEWMIDFITHLTGLLIHAGIKVNRVSKRATAINNMHNGIGSYYSKIHTLQSLPRK